MKALVSGFEQFEYKAQDTSHKKTGTENVNLQFRAKAYNVFNHTNFLGLSTVFGSPTFGQVTTTRDPRLVQFGLKLSY